MVWWNGDGDERETTVALTLCERSRVEMKMERDAETRVVPQFAFRLPRVLG